MTKLKKVLFGFLGLILALVLCHYWLIYSFMPDSDYQPAWKRISPDGRFTVAGYGNKGLKISLFAMPGGGGAGSGAGTIILRENRTDKILNRQWVDYLPPFDTVDWDSDSVDVGRGDGSFSWPLPPAEPGSISDPDAVSRFFARECANIPPIMFPESKSFLGLHGINQESIKGYPDNIKCPPDNNSMCDKERFGEDRPERLLGYVLDIYCSDSYRRIPELMEKIAMCESFVNAEGYKEQMERMKSNIFQAIDKFCTNDAHEVSLILEQVFRNNEDKNLIFSDCSIKQREVCASYKR